MVPLSIRLPISLRASPSITASYSDSIKVSRKGHSLARTLNLQPSLKFKLPHFHCKRGSQTRARYFFFSPKGDCPSEIYCPLYSRFFLYVPGLINHQTDLPDNLALGRCRISRIRMVTGENWLKLTPLLIKAVFIESSDQSKVSFFRCKRDISRLINVLLCKIETIFEL